MSATRCTCIRDGSLIRVVADPACPAWGLHVQSPVETPSARRGR